MVIKSSKPRMLFAPYRREPKAYHPKYKKAMSKGLETQVTAKAKGRLNSRKRNFPPHVLFKNTAILYIKVITASWSPTVGVSPQKMPIAPPKAILC